MYIQLSEILILTSHKNITNTTGLYSTSTRRARKKIIRKLFNTKLSKNICNAYSLITSYNSQFQALKNTTAKLFFDSMRENVRFYSQDINITSKYSMNRVIDTTHELYGSEYALILIKAKSFFIIFLSQEYCIAPDA